jgi:uncharacterized protein YjdB
MVNLKPGGTLQLTATAKPTDASLEGLHWSSNDEKVVTVDSTGKMTAVGNGVTDVFAEINNKWAHVTVMVTTPIKQISIKNQLPQIKIGDKVTLKATIEPTNATNPNVRWVSVDPDIASVDQNGKVTGLKDGTTEIRAISPDNANLWGSTFVVVDTPVTAISLSESDVRLFESDKNYTLSVITKPTGASLKNPTNWSSSNTNVATVDNFGKVKIIAAGTTKITVTSGTLTAEATVTVKRAVNKITLTNTEINLPYHKTIQLSEKVLPKVYPENATTKDLKWTAIENGSIISLNSNGNVSGSRLGTAKVKVSSVSNPEIYQIVTINVTSEVKSITLDKETADLKYNGDILTLVATVLPDTASDKSVKWESSNEKIAKVDKNGVVTPVAVGSATIKATAVDGGYVASCVVTVKNAATSLVLTSPSDNVAKGKSITLTAGPPVPTAYVGKVTWKSSDESIATVDSDGNVTGKSVGQVTITATAAGEKISKSIKLFVYLSSKAPQVTVNESLVVGKTNKYSIKYTTPSDYDNNVSYTIDSDSQKYATLSIETTKDGQVVCKLTGKAKGKVYLTISLPERGFKQTYTIYVSAK